MAKSDLPEVSVIVPTTALARRAALIHRALESILTQNGVRTVPIVVVNGSDRDRGLTRELASDQRLRVVDSDVGGIPTAFQRGRAAVDSPWFSALDDDDVYLPGALAARVGVLSSRPDCDTVVTNGLRRNSEGERLHVPDMAEVARAPLDALEHGNWLLPGSWLCRSDGIGVWVFEGMPQMLECTYLALRFALHGKLCFLSQPTMAWSADTPGSESKSRSYVLGQVAALERILELPLPDDTRAWLRKRVPAARQRVARLHFQEQHYATAWRWHLTAVLGPGGWRYLPFSLRLLLGCLKR